MYGNTLVRLLEQHARERPRAEALRAPSQPPLTYGELAGHVERVSGLLAGRGFGREDRIALALPDEAATVTALLSVTAVAIAAPLPIGLPLHEARQVLSGLGARAIAVPQRSSVPAAAAARELGIEVLELESRPSGPAGLFDLHGRGDPGGLAAVSAASPADAAFVLCTSGTAGEPRRVRITHAQFCGAGRDACRVWGLTADDRGFTVSPLFHLAALYHTLAFPLVSGSSIFVSPGFAAERFRRWFQEAMPTYFGASPAVYQAILDRAGDPEELRHRAPLRFVRSAAAPLPSSLKERVEALFGVPVLEAYALTEAGLVTAVTEKHAGRKPGSVGRSVGPSLAIVDASGRPLPTGLVGEIVVEGPGVMAGYDGDPEATSGAFFGHWLRTGDLGRLDADGDLWITGRLKEQVNRGGEKISPGEVDEALLAHPDVAEAAAFGVAHPRLGEDLAAVVVLRPSAAVVAATLRAFVAARLAAVKVPSKIVFRDALPRNASGKVPRNGLAAMLGLTSDARPAVQAGPESAASSTASVLERAIAEQLANVLGVQRVSAEDDFFELGGDSVAAAQLMARLHERLGVSLPVSVLFDAPSAGALAEHVGTTEGAAWGPLVPLRARGAGQPLFFVHGLGGGVMFLSKLASRLEGRPFFGLQAPGFDGAEPPLTDVPGLAAHYVRALQRRQPLGPYLLGGFCMGSAVALEMARQLEHGGQEVSLLVLLDPPPLPLGARRRPQDRLRVALSALANRLHRNEPGPPISPVEAPLMQANRRALRRYRPRPVEARLALFLAGQGPPEAAEEAEHALRRLTRGGVRVERIGAGHAELLQEPAVDAVATRIEALLAGLGASA